MIPLFTTVETPKLADDITVLLPHQGSFELQHDQPGKVHDWHFHNLDEELLILRGQALLFWDEDGALLTWACPVGTWITLPAGTVHGSVAGPGGVVYMIRPKDGRTAETTFLARDQHPHTTPTTSAAAVTAGAP